MSSEPLDKEFIDYYQRIINDSAATGKLVENRSLGHKVLSDDNIRDRIEVSKDFITTTFKGNVSGKNPWLELYNVIDRKGPELLRGISDGDANRIKNIDNKRILLEAIIKTDGTRPSFLIRNGTIDFSSSPAGTWEGKLTPVLSEIEKAVGCVARVEDPSAPQGYWGTCFLIHENLVITNRHVLQGFGAIDKNGNWQFRKNVTVNFAHEHNGLAELNRRKIKDVLFCGSLPDQNVDHSQLDLALLELETCDQSLLPDSFISIDSGHAMLRDELYVIGYPGDPNYTGSILDSIFTGTFGFKRFAPGSAITSPQPLPSFGFAHDATTLGGNSGSLVITPGRELFAAGLHYGGHPMIANYAHHVPGTLHSSDIYTGKVLQDILKGYGCC